MSIRRDNDVGIRDGEPRSTNGGVSGKRYIVSHWKFLNLVFYNIRTKSERLPKVTVNLILGLTKRIGG